MGLMQPLEKTNGECIGVFGMIGEGIAGDMNGGYMHRSCVDGWISRCAVVPGPTTSSPLRGSIMRELGAVHDGLTGGARWVGDAKGGHGASPTTYTDPRRASAGAAQTLCGDWVPAGTALGISSVVLCSGLGETDRPLGWSVTVIWNMAETSVEKLHPPKAIRRKRLQVRSFHLFVI
ncbi:unnamed protein product [Toxocara canis]|uniref:RING-CH-type domain-containing protein n=1 Tax=Toxocara canis TaxID=6265 RepID=A0A183U5R6_TOXCA|nr:unnamed protein product [Toxocara canis]